MTAHRSGSFVGLIAASASAALVTAALVAVAPMSARAQDAAGTGAAAASGNSTVVAPGANSVGEIDNGKFQVQGRITSNAVYVRSGPSDNDYPTTKLDSGATVTFVGAKFDWLKIL